MNTRENSNSFPTLEELRIKYADVLNNEKLNKIACWNETNTADQFNPVRVTAFAKDNAQDFFDLCDAAMDEVCQQS